MLYVKEGKFDISPEKKIVKAKDYGILLKAKETIAFAQKKAEEIIEAAKQAYEDEKKRGFEEGMAKGNAKISELMIDTIDKSVQNFEEFENDVIKVVIDSVRKVIGDLDKNELISKIVRNALDNVRNQKKVTLIVNPSDAENIKDQIDNLLKEYPSINYIETAADPRVKAGGCKLETEMGVVDASIEVQIEAIKNSLTRAIK